MKVLRLLIFTFKLQINNLLKIMLLFLCLPLMLTIFMVFVSTGVESEEEKISLKVYVEDQEKSEASEAFVKALEQVEIIQLEEKRGDYNLIIPEGFSGLLEGKKGEPIQMQNLNGSRTGEKILLQIMDNLGKGWQTQTLLAESLQTADLSAEKVAEVNSSLQGIQVDMQDFLKYKEVDMKVDNKTFVINALALAYLGYIFLMYAMQVPASDVQMKKTGLGKRIYSSPTKPVDSFLSDYALYVILGSVIAFSYVVIIRLIYSVFSGNLLLYLLLIVIFMAAFIAIVSLINNIIPNPQITTFIVSLFMIIQVMAASFLPSTRGNTPGPIFGFLNKIRIDRQMVYEFNLVNEGQFTTERLLPLGLVVLGTFIIVALTAFVVDRRKEQRI